MSKDIFTQYREEEIHTLVSMPYQVYKELKDCYPTTFSFPELRLVKHYNPEIREKAKKDPRWKDLEKTRKECKEEQKDIEFNLSNGNTTI